MARVFKVFMMVRVVQVEQIFPVVFMAQVIRLVRVVQVFRWSGGQVVGVVMVVSLNGMLSESMWFSCPTS